MMTRRDITAGLSAGLSAAALAPGAALAQAWSTTNPANPNTGTGRAMSAAQSDAAMAPDSTYIGAPREIVPIWPRRPPGAPRQLPPQEVIERSTAPALRDRAVLNINRPVLIVFRPAQPNGSAILLCTGGSYLRVVLDKEGYESAERFAERGITTFQLIYRLPNDGWAAPGADPALQDVQRAMRVIRARAAQFNVDPARVAVMGFSAGGHVASGATVKFDAPAYERVDAADDLSAKPDASILMYPVITMLAPHAQSDIASIVVPNGTPEAAREQSREHFGRADAPPTFLLHCHDDTTIPVGNSILMYEALRAHNVPTEMHLFETGGHGFGTRLTAGKPTAIWPDLVMNWLDARGLLGSR